MNTHSPIESGGKRETRLLCVNFNQDQGCFAIGHENGFRVYNTDPIEVRVKRNFNNVTSKGEKTGCGIGHVTMLHRTNYLALVGGGVNPKYANNKLVIWDDLKRKNSLMLEFKNPVLNVLLSRIRIIAVLKNQVIVYGFSSPPKKFATYETIDNDYGLADLSVNSRTTSSSPQILTNLSSSTSSLGSNPSPKENTKYQILAFPGRSAGQIQLVDVSPQGQEKNLVSIIKAHKSKIRCLALNRSGSLVASASETGTIIRVHSTHNTALLYEFRRGLDKAIIRSIKFSHDDTKLAVISDKNTLHVFNITYNSDPSDLAASGPDLKPVNRQHLFVRLPIPVPNYFKSTWSFCSINTNQYHHGSMDDYDGDDIGTIGWSSNDSIIIVWKNKMIWEKYSIVTKATGADPEKSSQKWELVRTSWKNLDELNE